MYVHTKTENSVHDTVAEVRTRIVTKVSSKFCHAFDTKLNRMAVRVSGQDVMSNDHRAQTHQEVSRTIY